jgi:hypothetical protein
MGENTGFGSHIVKLLLLRLLTNSAESIPRDFYKHFPCSRQCVIAVKYKNLLLFVFPSHKIIVVIVNPVSLNGGLAES